jgi:hypothetical protein
LATLFLCVAVAALTHQGGRAPDKAIILVAPFDEARISGGKFFKQLSSFHLLDSLILNATAFLGSAWASSPLFSEMTAGHLTDPKAQPR